ncbi:MAG TPA: hypothetical protein VK849_08080, partial [Longimicrobiales bacterium]|nr:hypothetical protein [Longimicrobiales bacterium]
MIFQRVGFEGRSAWLAAALSLAGCAPERPPAEEQSELGTVSFPTSCSAEARPGFERAVALLHHMSYPESRRAFEVVSTLDPDCAMARWGVAMTLFQPLWPTRPTEDDLRRGWAEVSAANAMPATDRERLFIAAAEAFFRPGDRDYWSRIVAWEAASRSAYEALPDDPAATVLWALSHLATAPATGGTEHQDTAAAVLLRVLAEHRDHPGAVHYTVHANDVAGRERESSQVVRSYLEIAPRNPHALHMPTHIFIRLGAWEDVIEWNLAAAEAALEHPAGDAGQWVWDEFPHALEYLVYAHLQRGDDAAAESAMLRLQGTSDLQPSFKTAFNLASIPVRYALERRAWAEAASLPSRPAERALPWDLYPWPEAISWFGRGLGSARLGDREAAEQAERRIDALREVAGRAGEDLFRRQIEILRLELAAWVAHAGGRASEALELMRAAVTLEAETPKHAVTPAPTLPALE